MTSLIPNIWAENSYALHVETSGNIHNIGSFFRDRVTWIWTHARVPEALLEGAAISYSLDPNDELYNEQPDPAPLDDYEDESNGAGWTHQDDLV